jgi:peptidoglycan/LPS O-acetylase OafA/YrhL/lysophospholipase L1-like esterase
MSQRLTYQPALDGLRAVSVLVVLLFHGGVPWMSGGYVGVSVFFTLSGFLITSLLLSEYAERGDISLSTFYTRRARRLLPASLACVAGVAVLAAVDAFGPVNNLRRDVVGAVAQVFNWVKLASGESYADINNAQAGVQKPLEHFWSLAIEEQFYWLWPVVMLAVMRRGRPLTSITVLTAAFAVAAPVVAAVWGADAAYWATPARVAEILFGALVAAIVRGRVVPAGAGVAAGPALLAVLACCVWFPSGRGPAYDGWFPLVGVASAVLILGLQAAGPVRSLLSWRPLVMVGTVSYGVYLYHWPVFVLVDRHLPDLTLWPALGVKCAITAAVAAVSFVVLERPVRRADWIIPRRALVGAALGCSAVAALSLVVPTVEKYYGVDTDAAEAAAIDEPSSPLPSLAPAAAPPESTSSSTPTAVTTIDTSSVATTTTGPLVPSRPVRILVVGDSTAEATGAGLVTWAAENPTLAQVSLEVAPGCPLTPGGFIDGRSITETCDDWITNRMPATIADLQPDVVLVMNTSWDIADRQWTEDGPTYTPMQPELGDAIDAGFGAVVERALAGGAARVVFVKHPIPDPLWWGETGTKPRDPARHQVIYDAMSALAADQPEVRVVDLAGWMSSTGLDVDRDLRPDGIHFSAFGAASVAAEWLGPTLIREALT